MLRALQLVAIRVGCALGAGNMTRTLTLVQSLKGAKTAAIGFPFGLLRPRQQDAIVIQFMPEQARELVCLLTVAGRREQIATSRPVMLCCV